MARAPAVRPFLSRNGSVRTRAIHDAAPATTATTTAVGRRRRRKREGGAQSALSMAMKGRPAPQLTEEELASMGNSREKVIPFFGEWKCSNSSTSAVRVRRTSTWHLRTYRQTTCQKGTWYCCVLFSSRNFGGDQKHIERDLIKWLLVGSRDNTRASVRVSP